MKQFLFLVLFIAIFASISEARVQRAGSPSKSQRKLWSQPFMRPQLFNVRQVLERTNGNLYQESSSAERKEEGFKPQRPSKQQQHMQQVVTGEHLEVFFATPFNEQ